MTKNSPVLFSRFFLVLLSVLFVSTYLSSIPEQYSIRGVYWGAFLGLSFAGFSFGMERIFTKFNLRSLNITMLGIFFGYLLGLSINLVLKTILDTTALSISHPMMRDLTSILIYLFCIYLGTVTTIRCCDELYISIPFVKLSAQTQKKKDLLVDLSALTDPRILDFASSGIIDHQLIIPRFLVKDLRSQIEDNEESKRTLDVVKKLEQIPHLHMRYSDTNFPETQDSNTKTAKLARLMDANILTAYAKEMPTQAFQGIKLINLHGLAKALKPLMQPGEVIQIKIQRYGKEPRQGVGYLDDGTMVVVNGGGEFIGEMVSAQVLPIRHSTAGRMIFCNVTTGQKDS